MVIRRWVSFAGGGDTPGKWLGLLVVFAIALCAAGPLAANSVVLSLTPESAQVGVGNSVDVFVGITGLGDPPALGSYDLTVQYDAALFSFSSVSFGDPMLGDQLNLSGFGTIGSSLAGSGTIEFNEASLDSSTTLDTLQASTFVLATIQFQAVSPGTGLFSFDAPDVVLGDALGDSFGATLGTAQVEVTSAAPEPYMFLPSLAALMALHFRIYSRSGRDRIPA